jgi:hypothetical protein
MQEPPPIETFDAAPQGRGARAHSRDIPHPFDLLVAAAGRADEIEGLGPYDISGLGDAVIEETAGANPERERGQRALTVPVGLSPQAGVSSGFTAIQSDQFLPDLSGFYGNPELHPFLPDLGHVNGNPELLPFFGGLNDVFSSPDFHCSP